MGATRFSLTACGIDVNDAFNNACEDAAAEYGQETARSKGFKFVDVPKGVKLNSWLEALKSGSLSTALQIHSAEFKLQFSIYDDKRQPFLCFEVTDKNEEPGLKKYLFTGWIPD